jgi:hypothetical protein
MPSTLRFKKLSSSTQLYNSPSHNSTATPETTKSIMQLLTWATLLPLALAAPVIQPRAAQLIPGNYIVKLKDGASENTLQDAIRHVKAGSPKHVYRSGRFKGFAAQLSPKVLDEVSKLPEVRSSH